MTSHHPQSRSPTYSDAAHPVRSFRAGPGYAANTAPLRPEGWPQHGPRAVPRRTEGKRRDAAARLLLGGEASITSSPLFPFSPLWFPTCFHFFSKRIFSLFFLSFPPAFNGDNEGTPQSLVVGEDAEG